MTVALPITTAAADAANDGRHYTAWKQVKSSAQIVDAASVNPAPADPGTVELVDRHPTEWEVKPRP